MYVVGNGCNLHFARAQFDEFFFATNGKWLLLLHFGKLASYFFYGNLQVTKRTKQNQFPRIIVSVRLWKFFISGSELVSWKEIIVFCENIWRKSYICTYLITTYLWICTFFLLTKIKSHISEQKKCNNYEFAQILVAPNKWLLTDLFYIHILVAHSI